MGAELQRKREGTIQKFGGLKGVLDKVAEATGGNVDDLFPCPVSMAASGLLVNRRNSQRLTLTAWKLTTTHPGLMQECGTKIKEDD